jgi:hypothetical protein
VVSAAHDARHLYDKDVMAGISDRDFLMPMMFFDACFLVQYMLWHTRRGWKEMDRSLRRFFYLNRIVLRNDIMLLENQLPLEVVKAIMRFSHVSLTRFVSFLRDIMQNRRVLKGEPLVLDDKYKTPHLLGLLRHHIVESRDTTEEPDVSNIEELPISVSAIELAEIGIKLRANETTEVISMGLNKIGIFFAELSLSPLSLTHATAIWLVNMVALELSTTHYKDEESAVCSYLHLLSMLVHREEDVQELRTRGILQGAGLTNKEALEFFTSFQNASCRSARAATGWGCARRRSALEGESGGRERKSRNSATAKGAINRTQMASMRRPSVTFATTILKRSEYSFSE